jgi:hypothetical protein
VKEIEQLEEELREIEPRLADLPYVLLRTFERNGRLLHRCVTDRLRRRAQRERVWGTRAMLGTVANAAHGFDEQRARSLRGRDGIFLLDRAHRPANAMMRKMFGGYLDRPDSGADAVAAALEVERTSLLPVRLVSHHLRLLGVFACKPDADFLILVDCDRST